jgi:hypothetical protein
MMVEAGCRMQCSRFRIIRNKCSHFAPFLFLLVACSFASAQTLSDLGYKFQRWTPLGTESLLLKPSGQHLFMLLSLDSQFLDGARKTMQGKTAVLQEADGARLERYPHEISFRFSIGTRTQLDTNDPQVAETNLDPAELRDHVQFQLMIFDGLKATVLAPKEVKMLGVPLDIPYNERIYKVTFGLPDVSVQRRMKLLILDPQGNRLTNFQLAIF